MASKPGFDADTGRGGETHQRVPKRGGVGAGAVFLHLVRCPVQGNGTLLSPFQ